MLQKILILILGALLLSACSESSNSELPVKSQIEEHNKKLEDGKAKEGGTEFVQEISKPRARGYDIEPDDMVLGNKESKVVFVEYFAPTCPHCVTYHKRIFPKIQKKYIDTGKIAYVMREVIGNKQDMDATILARCSGDIDNYIKFTNVILNQQNSWVFSKNYREILTNIGSLGGISAEQYAACLNDEVKIATLIENTKLVMGEPNFIGTPSFFINGKHFTAPYTEEELEKAINAELEIVASTTDLEEKNNGS